MIYFETVTLITELIFEDSFLLLLKALIWSKTLGRTWSLKEWDRQVSFISEL